MASHIIGKFCSVAQKDTIIYPKEIPGYVTPKGQTLVEDGQQFNFIYNPIHYSIKYELDGGVFPSAYKTSYTVEDEEYIPPTPSKDGHIFSKWVPASIPAKSIGHVTMKAEWTPNAILMPGPQLREVLIGLAGSKDAIMAIQPAIQAPIGKFVEISSTTNHIYASFVEGIIYVYSTSTIYCNTNMKSAFSDFSILRDISALRNFVCKKNTDINGIFKNCAMLSDVDPITNWAENGQFSDFTDALKGTMALSCLRVPAWYRWKVKTNYVSSTGVKIRTTTDERIPGDIIYPPKINGYKPDTESIEITSKNIEYAFVYTPIIYNIIYSLSGGEITNPKTEYTVEDETYYPPEPIKPGFVFDYWDPVCIEKGTYGDISFIANYKAE